MAGRISFRRSSSPTTVTDSGATARAEWVAGQYRDILGVEITLEPTDGHDADAWQGTSTYPAVADDEGLDPGLP